MDAGGGGADEVSRPEKVLPFWLKPLLSLRHPHPPTPTWKTDKARGGGVCWKHKQVSDSAGSKVNENASSS